jgi:membrane associated rhomboid family serine protease
MNPRRYAAFYLSSGFLASLAQIAASPHSTVPSLGASGAIAGVMGAFLVTYPRDKIRALLVIFIFVRVTFIPAALVIGVWFVMQLVNVGAVAAVQTGGIAYMAHIGGFIFGCITARLFEDPRRMALKRVDDFFGYESGKSKRERF